MLCSCVEQTFQNMSNCLGSAFCKRYGRKEVRRKFSGHCSPDYSADLIWNDYGLTIFHDIQKRWELVEWKRKFQECNFMILSRCNFCRCYKRITGQNEISKIFLQFTSKVKSVAHHFIQSCVQDYWRRKKVAESEDGIITLVWGNWGLKG